MFERISCSSRKIRERFFTIENHVLCFGVGSAVGGEELAPVVGRCCSETLSEDFDQRATLLGGLLDAVVGSVILAIVQRYASDRIG